MDETQLDHLDDRTSHVWASSSVYSESFPTAERNKSNSLVPKPLSLRQRRARTGNLSIEISDHPLGTSSRKSTESEIPLDEGALHGRSLRPPYFKSRQEVEARYDQTTAEAQAIQFSSSYDTSGRSLSAKKYVVGCAEPKTSRKQVTVSPLEVPGRQSRNTDPYASEKLRQRQATLEILTGRKIDGIQQTGWDESVQESTGIVRPPRETAWGDGLPAHEVQSRAMPSSEVATPSDGDLTKGYRGGEYVTSLVAQEQPLETPRKRDVLKRLFGRTRDL